METSSSVKNNLSTLKKDLNSISNAIVFIIGTAIFIISAVIGHVCTQIFKSLYQWIIDNYEIALLLSTPFIIGGCGLLIFKRYLNKRNDL